MTSCFSHRKMPLEYAGLQNVNLFEFGRKADYMSCGDRSVHSSYGDLFETSGVVIHDYEGSLSGGPVLVNAVTYNLNKCKSKVIVPYYKLLSLIAWRPFGRRCKCVYWCNDLCNFIYTFLCFCILLFWYYIRARTCQGHLDTPLKHAHDPRESQNEPYKVQNASALLKHMQYQGNRSTNQDAGDADICSHLIGTYVIPSLLHFVAFVIGFFHFRVQEHEGLYALIEKVYLQSSSPGKMTRSLRIYLGGGMLWLIIGLANNIFYFTAYGVKEGCKLKTNNYLMYVMVVLIVFSALFSNCVYVAVILSYCGQCKLLSYYVKGVKERLEEKTTELRTAMQDVLDIKQHFSRLNGMLSLSMSCLAFDLLVTVIVTSIILLNYNKMSQLVWLYRFIVLIQYGSVLIFLLYNSAALTSVGTHLREKALTIRVFGYQSHTQTEIDSFLNFLYKVELQAEIFTIPVKPRYLWGFLILIIQGLIVAFQTNLIENPSKWL